MRVILVTIYLLLVSSTCDKVDKSSVFISSIIIKKFEITNYSKTINDTVYFPDSTKIRILLSNIDSLERNNLKFEISFYSTDSTFFESIEGDIKNIKHDSLTITIPLSILNTSKNNYLNIEFKVILDSVLLSDTLINIYLQKGYKIEVLKKWVSCTTYEFLSFDYKNKFELNSPICLQIKFASFASVPLNGIILDFKPIDSTAIISLYGGRKIINKINPREFLATDGYCFTIVRDSGKPEGIIIQVSNQWNELIESDTLYTEILGTPIRNL